MGDISRHFSKKEFACSCGCDAKFKVSLKQIGLVERLRMAVGVPLIITSGCRCPELNRRTPGSAGLSWHMTRSQILYACDLTYQDPELRTPEGILKLYVHADQLKARGLGLYPRRLHVDSRPATVSARWIHKDWKFP